MAGEPDLEDDQKAGARNSRTSRPSPIWEGETHTAIDGARTLQPAARRVNRAVGH